jgi:hypothetical protein
MFLSGIMHVLIVLDSSMIIFVGSLSVTVAFELSTGSSLVISGTVA